MFTRSLTLITLLAIASPVLAADSDSPLAQERGRTRPLIVIAPSSVDPTLVQLKQALDKKENKDAFSERKMVLFTVVNMIGQRDGKNLDPQATMALIRDLKLGASTGTKVILVGKDGEKKLEETGNADIKKIFSTVDALPTAEKEASVAAAPESAAPAPAEKGGKPAKSSKPAKPVKPAEYPDD